MIYCVINERNGWQNSIHLPKQFFSFSNRTKHLQQFLNTVNSMAMRFCCTLSMRWQNRFITLFSIDSIRFNRPYVFLSHYKKTVHIDSHSIEKQSTDFFSFLSPIQANKIRFTFILFYSKSNKSDDVTTRSGDKVLETFSACHLTLTCRRWSCWMDDNKSTQTIVVFIVIVRSSHKDIYIAYSRTSKNLDWFVFNARAARTIEQITYEFARHLQHNN